MKPKIMICLDRLKYPHCGLGRTSVDYSQEIIKQKGLDFHFLVPEGVIPEHLASSNNHLLNWHRKFYSGYLKDFDLCHVTHQLPGFPVKRAKKLVVTIHDLNFLYTKSPSKQEKYKKKVQQLIDQADAICFISEFTKNDCLQNLSVPEDKLIRVIYNGVNPLPQPSQKPNWCPDKFIFTIGQFLEKKNFHVLIPFIELLPADYHLVIAGENGTHYGEVLKNLVDEKRLKHRIVLPGAIDENTKSYLYNSCEAFVFPSIAEGFGLPVIEAMKCGKPVFCSDKTSLTEIGRNHAYYWGDFHPSKMKATFEKGIADFKANPNKRDSSINYANSYTWEKNVTLYMNLYKELLS
jgi:glycosyltransferase involved in cell wall biosynthesis